MIILKMDEIVYQIPSFNNEKQKAIVDPNPCNVVREFAAELGICFKTATNHLQKLVPKLNKKNRNFCFT